MVGACYYVVLLRSFHLDFSLVALHTPSFLSFAIHYLINVIFPVRPQNQLSYVVLHRFSSLFLLRFWTYCKPLNSCMVLNFLAPHSFVNWLKSLLSNSLPWSWRICLGMPNLRIKSLIILSVAVCDASFFVGYACVLVIRNH